MVNRRAGHPARPRPVAAVSRHHPPGPPACMPSVSARWIPDAAGHGPVPDGRLRAEWVVVRCTPDAAVCRVSARWMPDAAGHGPVPDGRLRGRMGCRSMHIECCICRVSARWMPDAGTPEAGVPERKARADKKNRTATFDLMLRLSGAAICPPRRAVRSRKFNAAERAGWRGRR